MSPFYAYIKNVCQFLPNTVIASLASDSQINDDWSYRYLIVFASREVGDEWWRAVSTSSNAAYVASVKRVNPQFYTHDPSKAVAYTSLTDPNVAQKFLGRVFFTLLPDRDGRAMPIVPDAKITDHISGGQ